MAIDFKWFSVALEESTDDIDTAQMLFIWGLKAKSEVIKESAYMTITCGQARTPSKMLRKREFGTTWSGIC